MDVSANGSAILAGNPAGDGAAGVASNSAPVVTAVTDGSPAPSANSSSWYDNIEDTDLRGYVQNKGWQSPKDVADGYRNLEKLLGGEKLPMPKGADDAEGWSRVYDALGRPQEASGYKINLMEGADPALAEQVQTKFHELGLSEAQGNALADWWNSTQNGTIQNMLQQSAQKSEADLNSLKSEWGTAYEENIEFGRRAAREYGMSADKLGRIEQAIGTSEMLKLFAQIGRAQGEGSFEGGGNSNPFGMTPEAAAQRISALTKDPKWTSAYLSGDADAQSEMARLQRLANPE